MDESRPGPRRFPPAEFSSAALLCGVFTPDSGLVYSGMRYPRTGSKPVLTSSKLCYKLYSADGFDEGDNNEPTILQMKMESQTKLDKLMAIMSTLVNI